MRYLLDTNTCIAIMRKDAVHLARLSALSPGDCAISTVTSYELYTGIEKCSNPAQEAAKVGTLLQTVHTIPFDSPAAREAARVRAVSINTDNGLEFSPGIGTFNVGGLSGSNALTLNDTAGSPVTLAIGGNNQDTTYSGAIGGSGGLVKAGNGTLNLTGSGSWTGGLVVDPGIVAIGSDAALGAVPASPSTNITFTANGTLRALNSLTLAANRNISIAAGSTATFDPYGNTLSIGGAIGGSGALAVTGGGTLVLTGSNSYSGGTSVECGVLEITDASALPGGTSLTVDSGGTFVFDPSYGEDGSPAASTMLAPAAIAVPEPSTLVLLGVAALVAAFKIAGRRNGKVRSTPPLPLRDR